MASSFTTRCVAKWKLFSEIVTQKDIQAKSSKIVAGLEADKTNELFQAIAFALENKLDSQEAVNAVKNGVTNGVDAKAKSKGGKTEKPETKTATKPAKAQPPSRDRTPAKPEPKKALTSQRSVDKKTTAKDKVVKEKERSTSKSRAADPKDAKKVRKASLKEPPTKVNGEVLTNGSFDSQNSLQSLNHQNSIEKRDEPTSIPEPVPDPPAVVEQNVPLQVNGTEIKLNGNASHEPEPEMELQQEQPRKPQDELAAIIDEEAEFRRKEKVNKKLSAKHRQKSVEYQPPPAAEPQEVKAEKSERLQSSFKRESFDRPRTSLRPPSARPASSRPAAPRRRDKNIEIVLQPDETMKLGEINVKMEHFTKELEDDGENLVIIEDSTVTSDTFMMDRLDQNSNNNNSTEGVEEDEQGKLVQQILETEKNFEGALGMEAKKTEIVSFMRNLNFLKKFKFFKEN